MKDLREYIIEAISNSYIFEMAYKRKDFINTCNLLCQQIVENWCLVRYCTLNNQTILKKHWQDELYAHCDNIFKMKIDSNKFSAIKESWIKNNELNDFETIKFLIYKKFSKENINDYDNVIKDFITYGLEKLMILLSNKQNNTNTNLLYQYIYDEI